MILSSLPAAPAAAQLPGAVRIAWLLIVFPLAGFVINGALSLWKPRAKAVVSLVGPAVLVAAFAVAAAIFMQLRQAPPPVP